MAGRSVQPYRQLFSSDSFTVSYTAPFFSSWTMTEAGRAALPPSFQIFTPCRSTGSGGTGSTVNLGAAWT